MIQEAVQLRASDIHVEPFEDRVRIRYRIDGVLVERDSPPDGCSGRSCLPHQDPGSKWTSPNGVAPKTGGSKSPWVRRNWICGSASSPPTTASRPSCGCSTRTTSKWGFGSSVSPNEDFKIFNQLIRRPNGIMLVTGPTGSGKTTTLYAALNAMNRPDRKIITAEDPVEYYLPGINQVEVRHNIGLDFARIIRSMLRKPPTSSWWVRCEIPRPHRWVFRLL
jgi:type IV pilus assembly protein PilB